MRLEYDLTNKSPLRDTPPISLSLFPLEQVKDNNNNNKTTKKGNSLENMFLVIVRYVCDRLRQMDDVVYHQPLVLFLPPSTLDNNNNNNILIKHPKRKKNKISRPPSAFKQPQTMMIPPRSLFSLKKKKPPKKQVVYGISFVFMMIIYWQVYSRRDSIYTHNTIRAKRINKHAPVALWLSMVAAAAAAR
jgi:hypothetical protein